MALSLREKLKTAGLTPKARPAGESGLYVRSFSEQDQGQGLDETIAGASLKRLTGEEWPDISREDILFLDTETNGLSGGAGTVAFLVGVGYYSGNQFHVDQYLMRDYPDETALIMQLSRVMETRNCLCTYNGLTFDVPLLRSRFIMCGMRLNEPRYHLDLIHPARRVWKMRLGACTLRRVEEEVLGMPRGEDLPGALVPERYRQYLQEKNMALLDDILDHNRQDIASLPLVLKALLKAHDRPEELAFGEDVYSVGRVMEKRRELGRAGECYRLAAAGKTRYAASVSLGDLNRRRGQASQAADRYTEALSIRQSVPVYIALAKLYEHRLRDLGKAERCALKALELCPDRALREQLIKRINRIRLKQRRQQNGIHGCDQGPQSTGTAAEGGSGRGPEGL